MHEYVELVKALVWPIVVLIVVLMFRKELRCLMREMPNVVRRMRSAHALGVEIELDKLGEELVGAESKASSVSLPMPPALLPSPSRNDGGTRDA